MKDFASQQHTVNYSEFTENRYKQLYEKLPMPYHSLNHKGIIKEVNPEWLQVLGYEKEEVIDRNFKDFVHPSLQDKFEAGLVRFQEQGKISNANLKVRHKKGHYIDILVDGHWGTDFDESNNQSYCVFRDISEQVKAQQALFDSEQKFALSVTGSNDALWVWNKNQDNGFWISEKFYDLLGYEPNEIGTTLESWQSMIHPKDRRSLVIAFKQHHLKGAPYEVEYRLKTKQGKYIWVFVRGASMKDSSGKVLKMAGSATDITTFKETQLALIQARKRAEESERLKAAFLANMSHEIRTPLNGILGFLDMLSNQNLEQKERDIYIKIANDSGDRLLSTINDILELSRIESKKTPNEISEVCLMQLFSFLNDFFHPQAIEKSIELIVPEIDAPLWFETDRHKLESIFTNLIKNALKFTHHGSIEITHSIQNNKLRFCIKDTGIGISPEKLDRIFNRFEQAEIEMTRSYEGSGLGLSIAKSYAEQLGGEIWVESTPNQGSAFYFSIEYKAVKHKHKKQQHDKAPPPPPAEQHTILVAEDDEASFMLMKIILTQQHYKVIRARNGQDAIQQFEKNPDIELIIMDVKMPVMDGIEATNIIREKNTEIPIIAQTAFTLAEEKEALQSMRCNDYISKPLKKNELLEKINQYLEH